MNETYPVPAFSGSPEIDQAIGGDTKREQPPSVLGEAASRLRNLLKRLSVAGVDHGRRMDLLLGPVPEDPSALNEAPVEQSELGKLYMAVDDLDRMVHSVENEMSRLQGLAG